MKSIAYISIFLLGLTLSLTAQTKPKGKKPIKNSTISKEIGTKTIPIRDSSLIDSTSIPNITTTEVVDVKYSSDSLDAKIEYNAEDSMLFDVVNNKIYLYGNADVKYKEISLTADYIIFDQANDIVIAEATTDSLGNMTGKPAFSDGSQEFTARKMKYNFKKEKGIVYDATTTQNDLYVLSGVTKFERTKEEDHEGHDHEGHDHETEDIIYNKNTIITTCDHPEPHFGIRSKKQKVIANKLIVTGPANLEIGKIPTPLWLPFGFFPIKKGQRNGIVFPRDYEFSQTLGFRLRNVGYYMGINDNMDIEILGDISTRGSWNIKTRLRYNKMYRFNGNLLVEYGRLNNGEFNNSLKKDIRKTFSLYWKYTQDGKAHPTRNFNSNVNFVLNNSQSLNYNDAQSKTGKKIAEIRDKTRKLNNENKKSLSAYG
ncbi:MAG: putative LPS assembly protein LptD, partial [Saprospiraceae bacterium]